MTASTAAAVSAADLVRRALQATAECDTVTIRELYADALSGWSAGRYVASSRQLVEEAAVRRRAFSDVELDVSPIELPDGTVVAEWRLTARHTGPFVLDDDTEVPPSGGPVELRGAMFARLRDGGIVEFRQYWNEADLLEQLGLLAGG